MKRIIGLIACFLLTILIIKAEISANSNKDQDSVIASNSVSTQIIGESKLYVLFPDTDSIFLTTDDTSNVSWSISKQGSYGTAAIHGNNNAVWLTYSPAVSLLIEDTLIVSVTNEQNAVTQKVIYAEVYNNKYQCYGEKILDKVRKDFYHSISGLFVENINVKGAQSGIPCYLWPASHMLRALKNGYSVNPDKYKNVLRNYALALDRYKTTTNGKVGYSAYPGDPVRYYDDNGLLIIQFAEVAQLLNNKDIQDRAILAYNFNNSIKDDNLGIPQLETELGQGMFYSMSVNQTGLGAALLQEIFHDTIYLSAAKAYYEQLNNPEVLLKDLSQGLFHQYTFYQDEAWSYSGVINGNSRNGMGFRAYQTTHVIQLALELYRITLDENYLQDARTMMTKSLAYWYKASKGLNENSFWGGDDLIDALIDMYDVTEEDNYLIVARDIIDYLIEFGRDYYGYYPSDYNDNYGKWNLDRRNVKPSSFMLMGQAAAASGILRVAHADLYGPQNPVVTGLKLPSMDNILVYPTILKRSAPIHVRMDRDNLSCITVILSNTTGLKIREYIKNEGDFTIPSDGLNPGIYLLTISFQSSRVTKKIVIK